MVSVDEGLLHKVAERMAETPTYSDDDSPESILSVAAAAYSTGGDAIQPDEEVTQPSGFDPQAAALFEAVMESAFLVANADDDFDAAERAAFQRVIVEACQGLVIGNYCQDLGPGDSDDVCAFHRAMMEVHQATVGALARWTLADLLARPRPLNPDFQLSCKMVDTLND